MAQIVPTLIGTPIEHLEIDNDFTDPWAMACIKMESVAIIYRDRESREEVTLYVSDNPSFGNWVDRFKVDPAGLGNGGGDMPDLVRVIEGDGPGDMARLRGWIDGAGPEGT